MIITLGEKSSVKYPNDHGVEKNKHIKYQLKNNTHAYDHKHGCYR